MTMERLQGFQQLNRVLPHPVVVTIGNFDGVHLGHRQILDLVVSRARAAGGIAVAYTFRPHPQVALRPGDRLALLSTYDEKAGQIAAAGIDLLVEEPFSREFSTTSPHVFFNEVILRRFSAQEVVVGYDFAFGKGREGSLEVLSEYCREAGVAITVVPPHKVDGEVVSSSRIRLLLGSGHLEDANRLLGREFFYRGVVVRGEQRGRKLGFPTANLRLEDKLVLPFGVYATWAVLDDGQVFPAVTNIGVRPTFQPAASAEEADAPNLIPALVETHVLDQTLDLYGRTLEVRFAHRLREERKFAGFEALKKQIGLDAAEARKVLQG